MPANCGWVGERRIGRVDGPWRLDGDMRRLHEAASTNDDARLAIEMFCYSVCKQIAAVIAASVTLKG